MSNANSNSNLTTYFNELIQRQTDWNNGPRKISKQELYGILAGCLDLTYQIVSNHQYSQLDEEIKRRQLMFNSRTSVATRVVRCVFNTHDRALSAYAGVVAIARREKVQPENFMTWVNDNGGIDATRRKFAKDKKVTAPAHELQTMAKNFLANAKAIAVIDKANVTNCSTPHQSGFILNIARVNANGDYEIVASTTDSAAVRAALINLGIYVSNNNLKDGEEAAVRNRIDALSVAKAA